MTRAGEHIKGLCPSDFPSCVGEQRRIPSQCGGIAGHVHDPTGIQSHQRLNHLGRASLAGRIDYDAVEAQASCFCRGTVPASESDITQMIPFCVGYGIPHGTFHDLNAHHRCLRSQGSKSQTNSARAAVQISGHLTRLQIRIAGNRAAQFLCYGVIYLIKGCRGYL